GAAGVEPEPGVELGLGDLAERGGLAPARAGPQHVDAAPLPLDGVVQAVKVVQVGGVALDAGDVAADLLHGLVQGVLAAAGDEDVRSLLDEQLRAGQRHAGGAAGDDRYLAVKLSHGRSLGFGGAVRTWGDGVMYTDLCAYASEGAAGTQIMYTGRYPAGDRKSTLLNS